ncbi:patatin-like phospholipase family protein [Stenotrophomonas sp. HITSZ_GD]|uniref:patatin-like phospholipase family protein n=1 Tax=Stenotrophomonas sp. HITSZ_GD TaxID=3037248 RepID=UPI00240DD867|nr:patatin-like phospholipase family protein [Stenotrophomonas sp. HITSZ_GD]MDG2527036.1 patatin-like phospholipase family protein [Stenotrophomonas sp. HITSZ_GD]
MRTWPVTAIPQAWLGLLLCLAWPACAQPATPAPDAFAGLDGHQCGERAPGDTRPRIGLALGGGGARGIAHVRVLRKLEELHIPVDCIAGTSAGALVGALYAAGRSPQQIEDVVLSTDWKATFTDTLPRRDRSLRRKADDYTRLAPIGVGIGGDSGSVRLAAGLSQGQRLIAVFENATGGGRVAGDFNQLPIPFRAVATDINTGQAVALGQGSLAMAMRASMSLPGIMHPVNLDGRVLLDGGIANQIPIDVVRAMGAERIIAVDVGTPLRVLGSDASVLDVVDQMSGFLTVGSAQRQLATLGPQDLVVRPDLSGRVATGEFDKAPLALEIGQAAADAAAPALRRYSVDEATYAAFRQHQRTALPAPPTVQFVRLVNDTGYSDDVLMGYLPLRVGAPLDAPAVQAGILRAYGLGTLSSITYEVVREPAGTGVVVTAHPKPNGPAYVEAGMTLSNDLEGNHEANLRAGLRFSPISPNGAEARVTAQIGSEPGLTGEYYAPLDPANRYAFDAFGGFQTRSFNIFDANGVRIERDRVQRYGAAAGIARNFGEVASLGLGVERYAGDVRAIIGAPPQSKRYFQQAALTAQFDWDDIDSVFFPRDGVLGRLGLRSSQPWLGADARFDQLDFDLVGARSLGPHAWQLGLRYHATVSGQAPPESLYRLGGRWRLAGFQSNELTGQDYALGFVGYTYELGRVLGRSAQVGGTLEYGNAWQRRSDMSLADGIVNGSLFIGFDSWIGPLIFGMGLREGGHRVVFIELGQSL